MAEVVVADSSVLILLARTGRIELLASLYGRVIVPQAVWLEVSGEPWRPGATALMNLAWLEVRSVDPQAAAGMRVLVDLGEAEAITLAVAHTNSLLLIDDDRGRRLALRLGLRIKGTLGVLLLAKQRGLISSVRGVVDELQQVGIHVAPSLVVAVLRAAGE